MNVKVDIRPVILAGGLGTRLRPRTLHLPKPLLPVDGRPLLWHVLNSVSGLKSLPPKVVVDYKEELIRAYFADSGIELVSLPDRTMAEALIAVADKDQEADAFLGMSSDVLVPPGAFEELVGRYRADPASMVLFTKLDEPGHKRWNFVVENGTLSDILVEEHYTSNERVGLILDRDALAVIADALPRPITADTVPKSFAQFQTGWILLLKVLVANGYRIRAEFSPFQVCNVNRPADFPKAAQFLRERL